MEETHKTRIIIYEEVIITGSGIPERSFNWVRKVPTTVVSSGTITIDRLASMQASNGGLINITPPHLQQKSSKVTKINITSMLTTERSQWQNVFRCEEIVHYLGDRNASTLATIFDRWPERV